MPDLTLTTSNGWNSVPTLFSALGYTPRVWRASAIILSNGSVDTIFKEQTQAVTAPSSTTGQHLTAGSGFAKDAPMGTPINLYNSWIWSDGAGTIDISWVESAR